MVDLRPLTSISPGQDARAEAVMLLHAHFDPFSIAIIKTNASAPLLDHSTWSGFQFNKSLDSDLLQLNEAESESLPGLHAGVLRLNLEDVPLPELSPPRSLPSSDSEDDFFQSFDGDGPQDEAIDLWVLPDIRKKRLDGPSASWESFLDKEHHEPGSAYLSERPASAFNAIIEGESHDPQQLVKRDVLLHSFLDLCQGRSSVLFSWNEENKGFAPQFHDISALGYSSSLLSSCFEEFSDIGSRVRTLTAASWSSTKTRTLEVPLILAFRSASNSVMCAVDEQLSMSSEHITTLLQLRNKMANVKLIIDVLERLHEAMVDNSRSQLSALQSLIRSAARTAYNHPTLCLTLQILISRTCQPLVALISEKIGLCVAQTLPSAEQFSEILSVERRSLEALLGSDSVRAILEAQHSLGLLQELAPECPVRSTAVMRDSSFKALDIGFTFEAISTLQSRAAVYEEAMKSLIVSAESSASTSGLDTPVSDTLEFQGAVTGMNANDSPFRLEMNVFDERTSTLKYAAQDELHDQVTLFLGGQATEDVSLPLDFEEALGLSTAPLLSAQHRLLSFTVLQILVQDHNLLGHLNLQRQLHMLGNAFFSSRLWTALFDSNQVSGESQRKTGASTGLRLEARDSWPPAGSEIRLVLMSILLDSLEARDRALEDCISFAIRDMPLEELERCRDVDSIHALDFLRLQYTAPNKLLQAIFAPEIMDKYDHIFRHLLTIMRLHAVTQNLLREDSSDKVVIEMHHFVSTVADYCQNIAIAAPWTRLQALVQDIKDHIDDQRYDETLRAVKSLDHLRALQERTLDIILRALLLKQKHRRCKQILDEIFNDVLAYAARRRKRLEQATSDEAPETDPADETSRLHHRFRTKVPQFLDALSSSSQAAARPAANDDDGLDGEGEDLNVFECLLLRLNMYAYWTRRKRLMVGSLPLDVL